MQKLSLLFGPVRVPFLLLTPVCVLLGLTTSIRIEGQVNWFHFGLILAGAIGAHISVNVFNEVHDHISGLDSHTERTPFSGGSGTLQAHPELIGPASTLAWTTFAITALVGLYFVFLNGPFFLPFGLVGLFLLYAYTPWVTRHPLLCLIAPGLGFGPLMVIGVHLILTGSYSPTAIAASLVPFFLVNNLLLLNQFPDVKADRDGGRRSFPILIGRKMSSLVYGLFMALAYLTIIIGVISDILPPWSLLGLLTIIIAIPATVNAHKNAEDSQQLIPALKMNVLINLLTPVLVSIGLLLN